MTPTMALAAMFSPGSHAGGLDSATASTEYLEVMAPRVNIGSSVLVLKASRNVFKKGTRRKS